MAVSYNTVVFAYVWLLMFLTNDLCICRRQSSDSVVECIPSEREALLKLKLHLNDPSNRLASWIPNGDCCKWPSIVCSNVTGHVLQLHLSTSSDRSYFVDEYGYLDVYEDSERSRFGGEIHPRILDLKHLSYMDLSGNDFGETQIPSFLGSITSLTYLNLSQAGFGGNIPHQIGNLSNLLYLDLTGNDFNGSIPHQIGNLSNLLYLDLTDNDFSGSIPHQIGNLSNLLYLGLEGAYEYMENPQWLSGLASLQHLQLSSVNFSKAFDWLHFLHSLPSLTELHLSHCVLHHHSEPSTINNVSSLAILDISNSYNLVLIPQWISQLTKLVSLQLSSNQLQGSIPDSIQNLTLLQHLDLSHSSFNSSIPDWLYNLSHLEYFDLSYNNLRGTISNAIGNLTSLVTLNLMSNQLEGPIPDSLGNLTSLVTLDLSSNKLEGPIPNSFGNLCNLRDFIFSGLKCNQQVSQILEILSVCVSRTLETLSISNAQLAGSLTEKIGLFKNLVRLHLSYNSIQGPIPISITNLTSLRSLGLSKNKFSGNPFENLGFLSKLGELFIEDNLFVGVVKEAHLANFTHLTYFSASSNHLTLRVGPNWRPSFLFLERLYMTSWNLGPHFPSWIQSLKYLQFLDISRTNISDSIPDWFWTTYTNAYYFNLSNNYIDGELSSNKVMNLSIAIVDLSSNKLSGQLPHLSHDVYYLDLSNNWFSGSLTHSLCKKQDGPYYLELLNLSSNNLSGEIPDCWMMLSNLVTLKLENNQLIGSLPRSMGSLALLEVLHLRNNSLSGKFPPFLKNNGTLMSLDLRVNQFSGMIPSWVGKSLLNLKILGLGSNRFSGPIPHQICFMRLLQILDLSQNNLTGSIPKCVNHLSAMSSINIRSYSDIYCDKGRFIISHVDALLFLKGRMNDYSNILGLVFSIDLSRNKLSGEIPTEFTSLKGLHFLNLSNNLLNGQIPQDIGDMESLETLDLSTNHLCGEIPPSMAKLSFLNMLNLSYNNLTGKIPTGTQLLTFQASSFVGNHLCGPPLTINCTANGEDGNEKDKEDVEERGIKWFYVSMSLGFVVGFWGLVAPLLYSGSWRYAYFQFLENMWFKLRYCYW